MIMNRIVSNQTSFTRNSLTNLLYMSHHILTYVLRDPGLRDTLTKDWYLHTHLLKVGELGNNIATTLRRSLFMKHVASEELQGISHTYAFHPSQHSLSH